MLVCPFCRAPNPEDHTVCSECGRELQHGVHPETGMIRSQAPVEVESPPPVKPGPRWGRITTLLVVVAVGAGVWVWLGVRPQPCDHKFSSSQFAYCLSVPRGWTASAASIGPTGVDQFVSEPATAVVMSLPLRSGVTLGQYATIARQIDSQKGLTAGAAALTTLGGETAYQWDLSVKGGRFQGLEVVTVRDDVGWTLQLDDDQATYTAHVGQFRSMLSTFHFR